MVLGALAAAAAPCAPLAAAAARRCPPPLCVRNDVAPSIVQSLDLPENVRIGTAEADDMPEIIDLVTECFYKDALTLAAEEFTEAEMELLRPALGRVNGALAALSRVLLAVETRRRLGARLAAGGTARSDADSLMLVLQEGSSGPIVGVAELLVQPSDGLLPGDPRLPAWVPFAAHAPPCAYFSNLGVLTSRRRRGLGRALLRACEAIAAQEWAVDAMYLHARSDDDNLLGMYAKWGYDALPEFDQPGWLLAVAGREPIRFHVRRGLT